jgi:magnesium chelatase subunit D
MRNDQTSINRAASVSNYLNLYLGQDQGVRLGESSVVSRKVHARMPEKRVKGQIKVLVNKDAGKTYLNYVEADQIVHIDVYHQAGKIDPQDVAKKIFWAIDNYFIEREPQLKYAEEERFKLVTGYAEKIIIATNRGRGLLYDLFQSAVEPVVDSDEELNHVHILARLSREEYYLVYVITEAVEETILASGVKLAKVRNVVHGKEKPKEEDFAGYLKIPWKKFSGQTTHQLPAKENVNQLIYKLAEKFGGVNEIEEFMESYSTNIFKRKGTDQQKKKWGDVEHYVKQLEELELLKQGLLGKVLTKQGLEIREYIIKHKCELETEIRRNMRRMPAGRGSRFKKMGPKEYKLSAMEFTNYNKTINNPQYWSGDLAVKETIVQAAINSLIRDNGHFSIKKEDLHYYQKKNYIPIDVCLLIDASGSMAGEKRQAACFLAQNLLLSGKERVAVVTFQDRKSQVVVPFTRNQRVLHKGLSTINPAGFTPMASGIMTVLKLIDHSQVSNPLVVLITDGVPNIPLWTLDAKADGLKAASLLKGSNIRFLCIGVESNRFYMEKVAEAAGGTLYLVDDLNRENLINIVRHEKKNMTNYAKKMA